MPMRKDIEKELLIKAIDSFERSIVIISPEFKILSANQVKDRKGPPIKLNQFCYKALFNRESPCKNCLAKAVLQTQKSAMRMEDTGIVNREEASCLYAYPIFTRKKISSLALLDFPILSMGKMIERLNQYNGFLRNLIKSGVDAIIASDMAGKILIFNDAACDITGYTAEEVGGTFNIREIYPDDGAKQVMRTLRSDKYGEKGTVRSFRVNIQNKAGEPIPINLSARIVYDGKKEVATLGFFYDLRETLKMEAELEKTRIQLLQAEKMSSLGELAAGVAHQLNNPLGGITLFSQLILEEYDLPEGAKKDMARILQDAKRCSDIVKELLTFSRKTGNEMYLQDINQILSDTLFLVESQALFQNIQIQKTFDANLPLIPVDVQKIKHVFMNIILNAVDAMKGKGSLSLFTGMNPSKDKVIITIKDTGPGIPDDVLLKIFDPFFTTKDQGKGTGLGLSIAYRVVEDHGGKLSAVSKVGKGTEFIVELLLDPPTNGEGANGKK
ncbi:MAG: ATP-binding protein [Pseudomonadota bacterium]